MLLVLLSAFSKGILHKAPASMLDFCEQYFTLKKEYANLLNH